MFNAPLGIGIVFGPQPNKLVQVMRPENRPISRQVVKVVHDNGDEEIDDLYVAEIHSTHIKSKRSIRDLNNKIILEE